MEVCDATFAVKFSPLNASLLLGPFQGTQTSLIQPLFAEYLIDLGSTTLGALILEFCSRFDDKHRRAHGEFGNRAS